jgi:hypothetical protein
MVFLKEYKTRGLLRKGAFGHPTGNKWLYQYSSVSKSVDTVTNPRIRVRYEKLLLEEM